MDASAARKAVYFTAAMHGLAAASLLLEQLFDQSVGLTWLWFGLALTVVTVGLCLRMSWGRTSAIAIDGLLVAIPPVLIVYCMFRATGDGAGFAVLFAVFVGVFWGVAGSTAGVMIWLLTRPESRSLFDGTETSPIDLKSIFALALVAALTFAGVIGFLRHLVPF